MFNRRVLIFSRQDDNYATCGSLCGMAKLTVKDGACEVCVFVSNLQTSASDEWWGVVSIDGKKYADKLTSFNNFCFTVPEIALENVGFLLVKMEQAPIVVAESYLGSRQISAVDKEELNRLLCTDTQYEQFVSQTSNYYPSDATVDVLQYKKQSKQKYAALQDYSAAFERYYATGRGDNYLLSVKPQLDRLFQSFPAYYPLINKYEQSYFVRIDFPQSDGFFVVGVLTVDKLPKYICYALPGQRDGFCDKDFTFVKNEEQGFWMLFQEAENGQITTLSC